MNPAEAVILYLPIPYWAAFSAILYRHDLSRLIQPVRDYGSLRNWYNTTRPHMSLNLDIIETPHQAYTRKMPEEGTITDEKSGETYHATKS